MATEEKKPGGPDLSAGIPAADLAEGAMLTGHIGDDEVLLVRQGGKLFALSAHCTHYHGPLADGLLAGETIRCPWHHAHFNLQTGEAIAAPALAPVTCWSVEERGGKKAADDRSDDPDERGDDEPARVFPGQQCLGDRPSESAKNDESDDPQSNLLVGFRLTLPTGTNFHA